MKRPLAVTVLVVVTVLIVLFDGTIALAVMARSKGVERAPVSDTTMIGTLAGDADLRYAIRVPLSNGAFPTDEALTTTTLGRRMDITGRGPAEVVYRRDLPGLRVHVGMAIESNGGERNLIVTTVFHYRHRLAPLYSGPIRLAQWGPLPYIASRWAR